ncbi:MAG: hypothetical protein HFH32_08275 [Eubacterium sp.]|nr:hypothetical protein [Eubacterium sp.]
MAIIYYNIHSMIPRPFYHISGPVQEFLTQTAHFRRYDKKTDGNEAKYRKDFRILWKQQVVDMK